MGLIDRALDAATIFQRAAALGREQQQLAVRGSTVNRIGPLSPWAVPNHLSTVTYADDVFGQRGGADAPVSEQEALRVAPVKKARSILLSVLTAAPLVAIANRKGVDTQLSGDDAPTWLYRSDTGISPEQRMAGLITDHILHEATVLAVTRGTASNGRADILDAVHVPYDWWAIEDDGTFVWVDPVTGGRAPARADEFVWIPGPSAGLLVEARSELRQWLAMGRNISNRLSTPLPGIVISDDDSGDLNDDEVDAMVAKIATARRSPDGGVMYLPKGWTATPLNANDDAQLFIEARNACRIDLANHLAMPVSLLDGSPATASLTYSTGEGKRSEFDDLSLAYWTTPLTAGLSQDNVVPRGTRIRFDFTARYAVTNAPTGALTQD